MRFERFIAGRFMPRSKDGGGFSGPLTAIAVASIALGVVVMVMAVSILRGFQGDIADKVAGFGSHLTVSNYAASPAYQEVPVAVDSALMGRLSALPGVRHLQCFATKGGMVKTGSQIYGILFRGLSGNYDTSFFAACLVDGRIPKFTTPTPAPPYREGTDKKSLSCREGTDKESLRTAAQPSNEVLISSTIANKLQLGVGDKMRTYFWNGSTQQADGGSPYRSRAFTVCGIYNTDLTEMDEVYVIGDLRQVQRLNGWESQELVGGYELLVEDFDRLEAVCMEVRNELPYDLNVQTIKQAHPSLFSWLDLLNSNITLILTIMCLVSAIAIVSALLIMIFEKSRTIGLLKSLGASNASVRRIFLLKASRLIAEGILLGNALSLALCMIQARWQPLRLDPESYSMSHVPVDTDPWIFILISAGTLVVCLLALLLPAAYISHISPAQTMRTDK